LIKPRGLLAKRTLSTGTPLVLPRLDGAQPAGGKWEAQGVVGRVAAALGAAGGELGGGRVAGAGQNGHTGRVSARA